MPSRPDVISRWAAFGATLALLTFERPANAAPAAHLVYSRAADAISCPDEAALRQAVSQRVGYDAFFPWAPRTVVVAIVRRQDTFLATVSLVDENGIDHGTHELRTGAACVDLLDTVALAVAIAIDPQSLLATPAWRAPPPPPPEPPLPIPIPAPVDENVPSATSAISASAPAPFARSFRFEASLGGVATFAMAPSPAVGATMGADIRWSRFSLGVEGLLDAPASTSISAGGRASAWLTYAAVVPCVYFGPLFGCAVAQAGALESSGEGLSNTTSASTAWWALGGRAGAIFPLSEHLLFRLHGDLVGDLVPTRLVLDGAEAWKAPVLAGSLGIDAVVRF